jgi:CRISPR-associated exonuclease Cas4
MYTEDELLPISALQHLAFCERQWGLIHLEGAWSENYLTAQGNVMHEKAHDEETESRGDLRITRGLKLRSLKLGVIGQADVVEFHKAAQGEKGISITGADGLWKPLVIEYKRGKPKIGHEDEVQLCAQVMCIEEMLGIDIASSSFFYGQPRRRYDLNIDNTIRKETEALIIKLHKMNDAGITPAAVYTKRCQSCSLIDICLPHIKKNYRNVQGYLSQVNLDFGENDETPA